jgi:AcrR family transcriptional regulator
MRKKDFRCAVNAVDTRTLMTILALAVPAAAGVGSDNRVDGRNLRAEQTRRKIVVATRALIEEMQALPKVAEVALRAGVSVRSVFQHFQEVETLFLAAFDEILADVQREWRAVEPVGPLADRIATMIDRRAAVCERVLPVRVAAIPIEGASPAIAERANAARGQVRQYIEHAFRPELDRLASSERRPLVDALRATFDWDMWMNMRRFHGLSVEDAKAVWHRIVTGLIGAEV